MAVTWSVALFIVLSQCLTSLFKRFPEKAGEYKGKSDAELKGNDKFNKFADKVWRKLGEIIDALDDSEKLNTIMSWYGRFHTQMGVTGSYMEGAGEMMVEMFEQKLGGDFTSSDRAAWLAMMNDVFKKSIDNA